MTITKTKNKEGWLEKFRKEFGELLAYIEAQTGESERARMEFFIALTFEAGKEAGFALCHKNIVNNLKKK